MPVVSENLVRETSLGYSQILNRCYEVLEWKNNNGECTFSTGGIFALDVPICILGFFETGVMVTNGTQSVMLKYYELESDLYKDFCIEETFMLRDSLAEGGKV